MQALHEGGNRHPADDDPVVIASKGGVDPDWPNGETNLTMDEMVRNIDRSEENLLRFDHVVIGSDLQWMASYTREFGEDANFQVIAEASLTDGYSLL